MLMGLARCFASLEITKRIIWLGHVSALLYQLLLRLKEQHMRLIWIWVHVGLLAGATTRADQQQPAAPFVLGYANKLNVVPGEVISFHLSSSEASVRMLTTYIQIRQNRASVSGTVCILSDPERRPSAHGDALCRTESCSRQLH